MRRIPLLQATAALLALSLAPPSEAARRFVPVGEGRGLTASVVPSMLVDREGLLWVGSREGLYRYDGYLATVFVPVPGDPQSISDVDIRSLYEGRDGALWISTNTAGLNRFDRRTGRYTRYRHDSADPGSLSDPSAYGAAEDAQGRLWVGSQRGLNRLDANGRFTRYFHEDGTLGSVAADWVYTVHLGPSGRLWIGTVGGGVDLRDETADRFVNFRLSSLAKGAAALDDVFALHESADGRLWVGTRGGLVVLDPARRTARLLDLAGDGGAQPLVTSMRPDREGRLWVATMSHGVIEVDLASGATSRLPFDRDDKTSEPATPQPVLSIATGPHHVFVGTWGSGVFRAPRQAPPFSLLANPGATALRNNNITAVMGTDDAGRPWIGSFGGGPQRVDVVAGTAASAPAGAADRLPLAGVVSLARMPDGRYYAGSTEGLYSFDEQGRELGLDRHASDRSDSIGAGYVPALLPWVDGALWVGVGGSGLHLRDAAGRYRAFRHDAARQDTPSGDFITALSRADARSLWVGTRSEGLNLCTVEPWGCRRLPYGSESSGALANHHVTALRNGHAGELWVATDGGGVHRITHATTSSAPEYKSERWGAAEGLIDDGVMAVEVDSDGSLWLSTRHGIARLDPATGKVVNHVTESGLPATHFNTGASASDASYLYFGSVDGLVSIPRGTALLARPTTPVAVTGIELLGDDAGRRITQSEVEDGFRTRYRGGLAIEFAVLDFAETAHQYAYRMHAGAPWISLGQKRQVTFLDLEPGHYRFEVRARDVFGQWATSRPLTFDVVPPAWMTPWFRGLIVAALVLQGFGLHTVRMRSLKARNAVLESRKSQRELALERARSSQHELEEAYAGLRQLTGRLESAKEDERTRISRELHDEFGQTLTAAKLTLQMLRRSTAEPAVAEGLAASIAMVDTMIREARDIARGLRPPLLDEAGLVPALEHHLKSAADRSGVNITLHAGPGVSDAPRGLNTTVFRVVQEAVSNALRHAQAASIRVALDAESSRLGVVIEDNGVGFDQAAVAQRVKRGEHLGLLGMTERVLHAGGTIHLDSRPGAGSRITVSLPYARPETNQSAHPADPVIA
jgi:signal transduction histidine kinase/ligand-binding sensor domain-containing protein